ncbi:hypothetical protein PIB30_085385 [Stylosanthes scabra]|uniref:PB1-like domain-containing protein n=1 Tax=Stylosanthes scabra TaxID=79078 RepID=A0ABU6QSU2_9FABA|nr:hypothetical protein [Stylosanthes scabra]
MVLFNITLYHRGHFGYVDGAMDYLGGQKLTIEDNDRDFWCVYEAAEQLLRLGYDKEDIAQIDALEIVRITEDKGHVDLFVLHEDGPEKGFPEIGYVDVGGDQPGENGDAGEEMVMVMGMVMEMEMEMVKVVKAMKEAEHEKGDGAVNEEATPNGDKIDDAAGEDALASSEGGLAGLEDESEQNGSPNEGREGSENSDDAEYVPSADEGDSADDIQFTDSDEKLDLDDSFFGPETQDGKKAANDKGKRVVMPKILSDYRTTTGKCTGSYQVIKV